MLFRSLGQWVGRATAADGLCASHWAMSTLQERTSALMNAIMYAIMAAESTTRRDSHRLRSRDPTPKTITEVTLSRQNRDGDYSCFHHAT